MKIAGASKDVTDLTRWNRSGLDRFRYVDGGAAEWVEYLRVAHSLLFARNLAATSFDDPADWRKAVETGEFEDGLKIEQAIAAIQTGWRQPAPWSHADKNADYRTALRAQYDHIPLDQTTQISRAFARAFHILTETLDAYANEGFLATATQAPHLRRLLELIDFQPRLAASASVPIALSLVADTARQIIDRGLSVDHMLTDGSPILTFESLQALVVDPGLNLLRASGWDMRSDPVLAAQSTFGITETAALNIGLAGTMAILSDGGSLQGATVDQASKSDGTVTLKRGPGAFSGTMQSAELLLAPAEVHAARPKGSTWIHFKAPPNVYVGQVVSLSTDPSHIDRLTSSANEVSVLALESKFKSRALGGGAETVASITGLTGDVGFDLSVGELHAYGDFVAYIFGDMANVLEVRGRDVRINRTVPAHLSAVFPAHRAVKAPLDNVPEAEQIPILGPYVTSVDAEPVGEVARLLSDRIYVDAKLPEGLSNGALLALKFSGGDVGAVAIHSLQSDGDGFWFGATLPSGYSFADVSEVAGLFATSSGLVHETRSDAVLFPEAMNGALDLAVDAAFDVLLAPGRMILVTPDPETATDEDLGKGAALTIETSERFGAVLRLTFDEDISEIAQFKRGHTVIYANVAEFSHGKSLPEKVLGSGDGSVSGQIMTLPAADIATRADPGFPGGVAPDIEITASGRKLQLVASAQEADLLQPSYMVQLAEDGTAEAVFLSRLPTEADSVRLARFRQGAGEIGNSVPPFAIVKPTPKNAIIGSMIQPLAPQFGADVQDAAALKSQGNSHFALMDRALSARDFAKLAESTTSVWHAHADLVREAGSQGRPTIALTIVPAGGGSVEPVIDDLSDFLTSRAMPGTVLDIRPYRAAPIKGIALVTLKKGYAQDVTILEEIQASVFAKFGLQARGLGRRLFVTEITAAIEAHEAVQNLIFTLTPNWPAAASPKLATSASNAIQAVTPSATQSVFFEAPEDIDILWASGEGA